MQFARLFPLLKEQSIQRSVLSQTQAANQWPYYQSKSIKGCLYEIHRESLELESETDKVRGSKALAGEYEKKIAMFTQKISKYDEEKAVISKEEKRLEILL